MAQRPVAIGLMLCEQVIIEEGTHNVTPVNCFNLRRVKQFPSERISFYVFALLTDGSGTIPMDLVLQRLDNLDEVFRYSFTYRFDNPLKEVRFRVQIRNRSFPVMGSYQLSLLAEDEVVANKKVEILAKENP
jgi:hypothetical protein